MAGILEAIDGQTNLVGQNRLELLLFKLEGEQLYGINVFKVREVLQCPDLVELPRRHASVRGISYIRGATIPVLDLNHAIGREPLSDGLEEPFVIIAEYNRLVQGFLVRTVEKIVNLSWNTVHPPPMGSGKNNYLTAVTQVDKHIVEIIDVEKVLSEIVHINPDESFKDRLSAEVPSQVIEVLVVDDSSVARKQIARCLSALGVKVTSLNDGQEAFSHLEELLAQGIDVCQKYALMISDIEMPEMDGYTLTSKIRQSPDFKNMHIVLHTSLSGVFNEAMVYKVGANSFLAKFRPDELAQLVAKQVSGKMGIKLLM